MIEPSPIAWILFGTLVTVATLAGWSIAGRIPWGIHAVQARLPMAVAFGFGPLIAGLSMLACLLVLRGWPGWIQVSVTFGLLGLIAIVRPKTSVGHADSSVPSPRAPRCGNRRWLMLLLGWIVSLVASAMVFPLTQNDSLEYMIAAREVFREGSLSAYPCLDSQGNESGFFGPWTHPPLYVSLLDLAACMQGHFREPGLARLIAPWAAIAAVAIITSVAAMASRLAGLLAGTLLISTPIFVFGADNALSDSLFVLGMAMVFALVGGMDATPTRLAAWLGLAMGLCLYTHSLAILCLPIAGVLLAVRLGSDSLRDLLRSVPIAWCTALAVGIWPYVRNTVLLGTPVSDHPLVFAIPSLCWSDFFETGRGLGSWSGVIQYGWMKGWFAIESLGWSWWAAIASIPMLWQGRHLAKSIVQEGTAWMAPGPRVFILATCAATVFLVMVLVSTIAGVTLLVKNERYFLLIQPMIAIVGGISVATVIERPAIGRAAGAFRWICAVLLPAGLSLLLAVQVAYRWSQNGQLDHGFGRTEAEMLDVRPYMLAMRHLRESTPGDAIVFTTRPADMFYSGRRMVSYLDPRLVDFYGTQDAAEAAGQLRSLGVTHLHVVDYGLPVFYLSPAQSIARDPRLSRLEFEADGVQLYSLLPDDVISGAQVDLLDDDVAWRRSEAIVLGGRKSLLSGGGHGSPWSPRQESVTSLPLGLFERDYSTLLMLGTKDPVAVQERTQYLFAVELEGRGFVRLWIEQFDGDRELRVIDRSRHYLSRLLLPIAAGLQAVKATFEDFDSRMGFGPFGVWTRLSSWLEGEDEDSPKRGVLFGDAFLGDCHGTARLERRFRTLPGANRIEIIIEHVGNSRIRLKKALLTEMLPTVRDRPGAS